mmetsp:Transcript_19262/g.29546  ORF Transcript_19262/g.29546 Transcript_19262/m.29546 type:complete len:89 (-) Transcript_19262:373-639(-)|eukprot:CAMPEP_0170493938 /NCGR_PEP_ID=MMETSP0208-20121228/14354_1 /TAXON_ID=197538 /ORGANISM="Strombidium inclinatum, Strain S3" /LENGTH=88 /DNA_ID=CAMNT_0010769923 /DNA_START=203 /DNA_END=469 /DNA_ORIENTATION=-
MKEEVDFRKVNKYRAFQRGMSTKVLKEEDKFKLQRRPVGYISSIVKQTAMQSQIIPPQPAGPQTAGVPHQRKSTMPVFGKANRPSTPI